jgi:hypothetical protein
VHIRAEPFTSRVNLHNYADPKLFCSVKQAHVQFSSSIFTVQDHKPQTAKDALRRLQY